MHIYAGKLKTPETGGKRQNIGIYSRTMYKSMFSRSLAAIQAEHWTQVSFHVFQLYGSAGNRPHNRRQSVTLDNIRKRQTPNHDTNGRPPEVYNHSGIIGNVIPGSVNQQKPSDHDKLETSNPNRHNFQTISKICTASFQIMPEVKKRYIIRMCTQGSAPAVQKISRNRPTITGNDLRETVFRFRRQF